MPATRGLPIHYDVFLFLWYQGVCSLDWVTLVGFIRRALVKPYSNYFKGCEEKFVKMKERESSSSVTIAVDCTPRFPIANTYSPTTFIVYDYHSLTANEVEVVQTLNDFKVMESHTIIIFDQRDNGSVEKSISKF